MIDLSVCSCPSRDIDAQYHTLKCGYRLLCAAERRHEEELSELRKSVSDWDYRLFLLLGGVWMWGPSRDKIHKMRRELWDIMQDPEMNRRLKEITNSTEGET